MTEFVFLHEYKDIRNTASLWGDEMALNRAKDG